MALHGTFGLVLFLLGKYSAGIARMDGQRLLRPAASYLLLGAYLNFMLAVVLAAAELGFPKLDMLAGRVLIGAMGVLALETLVGLVLEAYRPRVKGQAARLLYDSRLIGLMSQPENLVATAAHALDYQFGFKVSQTWLYRFFERAIAWIILLQLGALLASTAFVVIEPNEQGLLERFGSPVAQRGVLEPGLHFKWPWPIDSVARFRTREIQTVVVGAQEDKDAHAERTVVWARSHIRDEFNLLVASREVTSSVGASTNRGDQAVPVNLLAVSVPVQYRITNLVAWAYGHADAHSLLQNLATREVVRYLANVDVGQIMGAGRLDAAAVLRARVQEEARRQELGIQVVFLGLQHVHPPVKVVPQYEAVIGAVQEAETNILAARAYRIERELAAQAEATNLLARARGESARRVATAQAEGALFANQIAAQQAAPSVYLRRTYLDTLVRSTTNAQKIVLGATNTQDIVQFNLEEKIASDLLDVLNRPQK
jgi:regulator of protease activity HflC (stomatin/prohibitin superfamily)